MDLFPDKEISAVERRQEYNQIMRLGQNFKAQTTAIQKQTQQLMSAQLASTDSIIVSQERVSQGIDTLNCGLDRVEQGMYGLQAAFQWGISEVVWQIEQNREVLKSILQVLSAPLDTQAKELRKRAERAYENDWIDDALQDFLESEEKNRYDFSIHISVGHIYLFHKGDQGKALEYYDKAVKYARPESSYHTSYALLYKALILYNQGLVEEAERSSAEAINLTPNFAEALYQNAQYNAQLNNIQASITNLEKAIRIDRNYCIKADNDKIFIPLKKELSELFTRLREEMITSCNARLIELTSFLKNIDEIACKITKDVGLEVSANELTSISTLINRNSYFDALDASIALKEVCLRSKQYFTRIENLINQNIHSLQTDMAEESRNRDKQVTESRTSLIDSSSTIGVFLGIVLGFGGCIFSLSTVVKTELWAFPMALTALIGIPILGWHIGKAIGGSIATSITKDVSRIDRLRRKEQELETYRSQLRNIRVPIMN